MTEKGFWKRVNKTDTCWLWTGATSSEGYGIVMSPSSEGLPRKQIKAHRFAWEVIYKKPIPLGLMLCHKCDVKLCVKEDDLFIGTARDNVDDAWVKERLNDLDCKLSDKSAAKIREDYRRAHDLIVAQLAKEHHVTARTIYDVLSDRTWRSSARVVSRIRQAEALKVDSVASPSSGL